MRTYKIATTAIALLLSTPLHAKMEVHEWGTFTSLVGSNGLSQNGMYHEDEPLPDFVMPFGKTQADVLPDIIFPTQPDCHHMKFCFTPETLNANFISQKMETPVIYFYGKPASIDGHVKVDVKFPNGLITETYPAPISSFPKPGNFVMMQDGHAVFDVKVHNETSGKLPLSQDTDNIYYHARDTQSQVISTGHQTEKFIFYRGLGQFQPRVSITSQRGGVAFRVSQNDAPLAAFLINVGADLKSKMMALNVDTMKTGLQVNEETVNLLKQNSSGLILPSNIVSDHSLIRQLLIQGLTLSGLFEDEATAMINTWENGYLKTPGLRVLYILPRPEVDEILPLQLTPKADQMNRVFVARVEIMTQDEEKTILESILSLPKPGLFPYYGLGRFAESKLRRTREVYVDLVKKGQTPSGLESTFDSLIEKSRLNPGTTLN